MCILQLMVKHILQCEWEELLGLRRKAIAKWKYTHGDEYVIDQLRKAKESIC